MSGVFSDQAFVDLLIERIAGKFAFVPAWRLWFKFYDGLWHAEDAEAKLRDEYRLTVELVEGEGQPSFIQRRKAINAISQQAALWLLREDIRLRASPAEIAARLKGAPSDSLSACARESLAYSCFLGNGAQSALLTEFFRLAGACAKRIPNILIRTDHVAPNPGDLWEAAREDFGESVVRLPWSYWRGLPENLTPALALVLSGARLVFLDGLENGWARGNFPQHHLHFLARQSEAPWIGKDDLEYQLSLPSHFILSGPPLEMRYVEEYLRPHILPLSSVSIGEKRP